ncbi:sodium/hydrogen exchanger 7-like [Olea europaea var. sylvestris]|uniref:sodium/hydrogen exchanger 7-like n=1 Tax=Olea europaea var. sylvestris TaxID=158386 RepID=UPI000C1CEF10|nr:sodium/hydrogen exchanger 7-like [Olea europaea var. sylvestris]
MASILTSETRQVALRILQEESTSASNPTDAVIFVGISLVLGIACRHVLRGTRVPYTVALLILGIGLGALEYGTSHKLGKIGDGIRIWANIDPDLLLAVFLPALLFESSFSMEVHQIKERNMHQLLSLDLKIMEKQREDIDVVKFLLGQPPKFEAVRAQILGEKNFQVSQRHSLVFSALLSPIIHLIEIILPLFPGVTHLGVDTVVEVDVVLALEVDEILEAVAVWEILNLENVLTMVVQVTSLIIVGIYMANHLVLPIRSRLMRTITQYLDRHTHSVRYFIFSLSIVILHNSWIINSRATEHMTGSSTSLLDYHLAQAILLLLLTLPELCKLKKALYGLKQSPRKWFGKFSEVGLKFGLQRCQTDYSVFHLQTGAGHIILVVYVDDIVITGDDANGIARLKQFLQKYFQTKDLGKCYTEQGKLLEDGRKTYLPIHTMLSDPILPSLFINTTDYFSRLLMQQFQAYPLWAVSMEVVLLPHISFANDVIIFTNDHKQSIRKLLDYVEYYGSVSSQLISLWAQFLLGKYCIGTHSLFASIPYLASPIWRLKSHSLAGRRDSTIASSLGVSLNLPSSAHPILIFWCISTMGSHKINTDGSTKDGFANDGGNYWDGGPWAIQNILSQIKHILRFDRDTISHTYREENQVIDSFASEGWDQCKQEYGPPDLPQGTRALVQYFPSYYLPSFVAFIRFREDERILIVSCVLTIKPGQYMSQAQEGAEVSGVLTVMTLGMFYSAVARTAFKGESQGSLHHFWEMVAYIANTLIFILSGVVIAEGVLQSDSIFKTYEHSWGYLLLLYLFVQVSRLVVVGVLFPFLQYFGYGLDWKEAIILVWSGLRGAVALSLSLSVKRSSDNSSYISKDTGTLFVFLTGGIVFLTLIVNGSTTQFVLHHLNLDKLTAAKRRILEYTKYEMLNKALEAFGDLGDDEELGPADWPTVKRYIACLHDLDGEQVHPHSSENDDNIDHMNLKDIRVRFLNGVQASYWSMLDEGRITQITANLLMQSVDEAIDLVSREALCDWNGLKSNINMPNYYKFLQSSIVPQKLVTYFTVERLESACYICAAFLRAHRIARQQIHDFIGDSEVASIVIRESEQEGEEARKFLEDVRVTFPQVLRVVKTRQVTYSVLNHLVEYVHNLEKIGLLEEKEMTHLHDAVQTDLKKLLRNPPLVKIPKIRDWITANPLLGALPSNVRETLVGSTKEIMKLSGATLYREGSRPTGIWLISNGVVKCESKLMNNNHLLHPTFTHGSTLGLYEVLAGKPYICDIITDSVVLCFFIETEKILTVLGSDPAVEDFFWQESVIVLAKFLHPHLFNKLSMQDLRVLIAERSTMNIYIRGESFELPHHSIGFLLEGFIKLQGTQEELLTHPAIILPHADQRIRQSETSGAIGASFFHQLSRYQVETRARVIMFDVSGFESSRTLQRRSSSLISHSADHPSGPLAREHGGLMSWPEHFYKSSRQVHALEETDQQGNNLSARAMQLSIFGGMIDNNRRRRHGSFPRFTGVKPSHSLSYPRVPSNGARRLVSVRSEGSSTLRKKHDVQESKQENTAQDLQLQESHARDDSSDDESGAEDEHIVRIDSPSRLSFRYPSRG